MLQHVSKTKDVAYRHVRLTGEDQCLAVDGYEAKELFAVILMSLFIAVLTTGYDKAKKKVRDKIQKHRESFRGLLDSGKLHRKASSNLST